MTKRDTIIIAILINAGLLAILFTTAMDLGDPAVIDQPKNQQVAITGEVIQANQPEDVETISIIAASQGKESEVFTLNNADQKDKNSLQPIDEVDQMLNQYTASKSGSSNNSLELSASATSIGEDAVDKTALNEGENKEVAIEQSTALEQNLIPVIVQKGDSLDKISRANGTTVSAIKKINNLTTDKLSIGQVLNVPRDPLKIKNSALNTTNAVKNTTNTNSKPIQSKNNVTVQKHPSPPKHPTPKHAADVTKNAQKKDDKGVYYTIKNGDNPWKLARQYHVKFEDLLKLNNLDEEKAKNLKVGDKIRVK